MRQLYLAEWERTWSRPKTKITFFVYLIILILQSFWLSNWGIGFYHPELFVRLDATNFSLFLMKEASFFLVFIILPMLYIDSLSGEKSSGAYRMVLIRPHSFGKFLLAKWLVLGTWVLIFVCACFLIGNIYGHLRYEVPSKIVFYPGGPELSFGAIMGYQIAFFAVIAFIYLILLGISTLLSTYLKSPILVYFSLMVLLIGLLYFPIDFSFMLVNGQSALEIVSGKRTDSFLVNASLLFIGSFTASYWLFCKRDWVE